MSEALRQVPPVRMSLTHGLAERAVLRALESIRIGAVELRLPDGNSRRFGSGEPIHVTVTSPEAFGRILRSPRMGLGESYTAGEWDTDDLPRLVALALRNVESWRRGSRLARIERFRPYITPRQSVGRARRNIRFHYDLGNDFYRLFLDESMTYSCAVWEPGDTLEQAQERKLRMVAEGLRLHAGDHVLEIGCGWGSFALFAARHYGVRVTGITISQEQFALARARVADAGLSDRIDIRLEDYRELEGQFTKIASIEMLEAIGSKQYPVFFAACDRLLAPGGLAAIQVIGMPDQRYDRYRRKEDWIQRHIFPGSLLPSLEALQTAMSRSSDLMVLGLEEIGPHYADTLRAWRARFLAQVPAVARLGFDERFIRTWDFYLATCEALFRTQAIRDMQLLIGRPFEGAA